ncbi:5'-methylthioadenosine/adenosylhomocysteine nucleosidase [Uliginosibacterium sp. 31-12]|uniref:5'-methylthioadenosine/adenosylhomocysteine nucleosidase n=1 Tax=Uliginosibacterium sp. 31-12 TaxID=3062781 RepID=UPI0026E1A527|nr:5'-methylthioadenosine/adenosylhomocysteine nucleosidase [Uliginosibacterium sp. 31-12]MDO6385374.1 5'-methylthioadenosine/adenosylhomocysteine nucleosidase [Uliginosibacterium sp. 31-12]
MIVILGAMDAEIAEFLSVMEARETSVWQGIEEHRGLIDGHRVLVSKTGVGKAMAAMRTQHFIDKAAPCALLFTGLAGSLKLDIRIGDTVIGRDLVQHDLESVVLGLPRGQIPFSDIRFLTPDPNLLALGQTYRPAEGQVHTGRICTGDQFITHREMKSHAYLHSELAGDAVEMEGAAVALVCSLNQVPYLVVRTISDMADEDAVSNFEEILPRASQNSLAFVRHVLTGIDPAP